MHDVRSATRLLAKRLKVLVIRERPVQRYSQVFGLGAEEKGRQDRFLWDAVLDAL